MVGIFTISEAEKTKIDLFSLFNEDVISFAENNPEDTIKEIATIN
jgi:hypothetical protein